MTASVKIFNKGGITFPTSDAGAVLFVDINGEPTTDVANFNYINGNLGLGITSALAKIHIKGQTLGDILKIEDSLSHEIALIDNVGNLSYHQDAFYIDVVNDRIGIGTSTPYASLTIVSQGSNNTRSVVGEHYDNTTAFSQFKFIGSRARGNRGNPSAVLANDSLASFNGRGYKTTGWSDTVGGMYIYANGNWTNSSTPTYITFRGVNTGTTVEEWARLNSVGLGIGTTNIQAKLTLESTISNAVKIIRNAGSILNLNVDTTSTSITSTDSLGNNVPLNIGTGTGANASVIIGTPEQQNLHWIRGGGSVSDTLRIARSTSLEPFFKFSFLGGVPSYGTFGYSNGSLFIHFNQTSSQIQIAANTTIGVPLNTSASTSRLHVKGNSDTVGNALLVEGLTNEAFRVQNNRDILVGGGSVVADTQLTVNPYRAAGTSNYVMQVNALGGNDYMRFVNSTGNTEGGLYIARSSTGSRRAFGVGSGGTSAMFIVSNGSIGFNRNSAGSLAAPEISGAGIINSNESGSNGLYFAMGGSDAGYIFNHSGTGSFNSNQAVFQIRKSFTNSEAGTTLDRLVSINGTYNFTNGTKGLLGIDYNMNIVSLTGAHYGLLIRPSGTLNGIGLGTTLPTATLHVKGNSDSVGEVFRVENLSNTSFLSFSNASGLIIRANPNDSNDQNLFELRNGSSGESLYQFRSVAGQASYAILSTFKKSSLISGGDTTMGITNAGGTAFFQIGTNGAFRITQNNASFPLELRGPSFSGNMDLFGGRVGVLIGGATLNPTSNSGNYTALRITNTINQTGGTGTFTAIDYNPTLTSILGAHYGLLIRPNTLNGFGLGSTLPTANLHVKSASDTVGTIFRVDSNTLERFRVDGNGNAFSNGLHMFGTPGDTPQAKVDISASNGYEQFLLRTSYTPSGVGDPNGVTGTIIWDDNNLYVKTSLGWKKAVLVNA